MAEKHALNRPGCISKHQELERQVSEGQSTMIIDTLHKALSSSIFSSHRLQVCKVTSYVGEYWEPQEKWELPRKVCKAIYGLIEILAYSVYLMFYIYRSVRLQTQRENRSIQQGWQHYTKQQYLHNDRWKDPSQTLCSQQWVKTAMKSFHDKQKRWQNKLCNICHELWPTWTSLSEEPYVCTRCKRDKKDPKLFYAENDMHPGSVPQCL